MLFVIENTQQTSSHKSNALLTALVALKPKAPMQPSRFASSALETTAKLKINTVIMRPFMTDCLTMTEKFRLKKWLVCLKNEFTQVVQHTHHTYLRKMQFY
jgi:hypothetical protein